ncbi:MAG: RNA pseudouridine synthase, partial [Verrucomicrobiia bacterium]
MMSELPLHSEVRVLAERENGLVVLEKPEGVLTHPNVQADERRSLLVCHYDRKGECYRWGRDGRERLWLAHRLDGATSGLLVASREVGLAERLRQAFAERRVGKSYLALVFGPGPERWVTWRDPLVTERTGGQMRSRILGRGAAVAAAVTQARCVKRGRTAGLVVSLLELEPETGRPHQLRVQCAARDWPIVGDGTYGDFAANRSWAKAGRGKRLMLHAWKVRLPELGGGAGAEVFETGWPEGFDVG